MQNESTPAKDAEQRGSGGWRLDGKYLRHDDARQLRSGAFLGCGWARCGGRLDRMLSLFERKHGGEAAQLDPYPLRKYSDQLHVMSLSPSGSSLVGS